MTRYEARIESSSPSLSHSRDVELAGHGERFLGIGCATGYLGRRLVEHGCEVSGAELDPDAARAVEKQTYCAVERSGPHAIMKRRWTGPDDVAFLLEIR